MKIKSKKPVIIACYAAGMNPTEIARAYGKSSTAIISALKRWKKYDPHRPKANEKDMPLHQRAINDFLK